MHGNRPGLPDRSVRLLVFRTVQPERVRQLLAPKATAECSTHLLCVDQISFKNDVGMSLLTNSRKGLWLPTFSIGYRFAFFGQEVACVSAFFPACSSFNRKQKQQITFVHPCGISITFGKLKFHNRLRASNDLEWLEYTLPCRRDSCASKS